MKGERALIPQMEHQQSAEQEKTEASAFDQLRVAAEKHPLRSKAHKTLVMGGLILSTLAGGMTPRSAEAGVDDQPMSVERRVNEIQIEIQQWEMEARRLRRWLSHHQREQSQAARSNRFRYDLVQERLRVLEDQRERIGERLARGAERRAERLEKKIDRLEEADAPDWKIDEAKERLGLGLYSSVDHPHHRPLYEDQTADEREIHRMEDYIDHTLGLVEDGRTLLVNDRDGERIAIDVPPIYRLEGFQLRRDTFRIILRETNGKFLTLQFEGGAYVGDHESDSRGNPVK